MSAIQSASAADPRLDAAERYARLEHHCALDHGYVCRQAGATDDFLSEQSDQRMIPARYLLAWQAAVNDFATLEEIEPERRQLKHYKFGFSEDLSSYIVHFQALILPQMKNHKPTGLIRATFGLTTRYWIDKQTMEVSKHLFYKF